MPEYMHIVHMSYLHSPCCSSHDAIYRYHGWGCKQAWLHTIQSHIHISLYEDMGIFTVWRYACIIFTVWIYGCLHCMKICVYHLHCMKRWVSLLYEDMRVSSSLYEDMGIFTVCVMQVDGSWPRLRSFIYIYIYIYIQYVIHNIYMYIYSNIYIYI
jgi:hypothetical protein